MKKLAWTTEKRKVGDLKDHPSNPRTLSKASHDELIKSFDEFDYVELVAVNTDNTILAGHQRVHIMMELGWQDIEIEVRVPNRDLTKREAKKYLLRSNKNVGDWDWDLLANDFELDELLEVGFTEEEMVGNFDEEDEETSDEDDDFNPDDIDVKKKALTKIGDVYDLNSHRIICGSSCDVLVKENLFGDKKCDLIITDPPYNVNYVGKTKEALVIENDSMDDSSFYNFLLDAHKTMFDACKVGGSIYVFHADTEGINFRKSFKDSGFKLSQCLMWVKQTFVMGRQDYHWKHEPILYGWKEGSAHNWYSDRKQTTVLNFDKPSRNAEHPTMKPLDILCYLIKNSSKKNELVFDPFLGSGSTLIASEQCNRICYGVELSPIYCDVIVNRFKEYMIKNNKEFIILKNGEKFEEDNA
ncbi:MAG: DNA modification methylase [Thermoplasmatales archaeon]